MKKLTTSLPLFLFSIFYSLFSNICQGQNYQNLCPPGITFFINETNHLSAFRLDSAKSQGNGDTLFYSYRTIYPENSWPSCFDTTNGSILGMKIYKKSNGTFYFFNKPHDTITIETQANLNQSWKFCNLTGLDKIVATVTSLETDSIFGTTQPVKVITLQAKNNSGGNINHYMNGRTIKISSNLGFVKTPNLYFVPDIETNDTASYFLAGMTYTGQGYQNLTWKDVFDFEVGDEFHFQGQYQGGPTWKTMKRVLSKVSLLNGDSVIYTFQYCKAMWVPQPPPNVIYSFDTITETYPDSYSGNNLTIASLPFEFKPNGDPWQPTAAYYNRLINFTGKYTQQFNDWNYIYNATTHCWEYPFEGGMHMLDFTEGLGVTRTDHQEVDFGVIWWWENLVYYQKGNETWGTPVATSCNTLVYMEEQASADNLEILVYPNPVETGARCRVQGQGDDRNFHYFLYDATGSMLLTGQFRKEMYLRNDKIQPGIYLLKLISQDGLFSSTKRIIFN